MKIYLIKFEKCGYDEYDAFVVIAKDKKRVYELVNTEHKIKMYCNENLTKENIESVKRIGETNLKEQIVLGSFNAG